MRYIVKLKKIVWHLFKLFILFNTDLYFLVWLLSRYIYIYNIPVTVAGAGGYVVCGHGSNVSPILQMTPTLSTFVFEFILLCLALYQSIILYKEAGLKLGGVELVTVLVIDQAFYFIA